MSYLLKSISMLALATAFGAVFHQALLSLHGRWLEAGEFYSHGYAVLAISIVIFFREFRKEFLTDKPLGLALLPLLALLCINFMAELASVVVVQEILMPAALWLVFLALWGTRAGFSLLLPVILLYFAIPIWDYLIPSLQFLAASIAGSVLNIISIPVFIEEFTLSMPYGSITVAGGCSGLKYLIVANLVAVLYCYMHRISGVSALKIVALAIFFGLLANWIRVTSLVLIGYYSQMQNQLIYQHVTYGWVIFAVTILVFIFVVGFISADDSRGVGGALAFIKRKFESLPTVGGNASSSMAVLLLLCYVGGRYALESNMAEHKQHIAASIVRTCPELVLQSPVAHLPISTQADYRVAEKRYGTVGTPLVYYIGYGEQEQEKELISSLNRIIDLPDWRQVDGGKGETIRAVFRKNNKTRLYEYAYYVAGHLTSNEMQAKRYQISAALRGRGDAFLVLAEYECDKDCIPDSKPLHNFVGKLEHCVGYAAELKL